MATWHCKKCGASGCSAEVMGHVSFDPGECPKCGHEYLPVYDEVVGKEVENDLLEGLADFLDDLKSDVEIEKKNTERITNEMD
jgi:hypothetical protein